MQEKKYLLDLQYNLTDYKYLLNSALFALRLLK